MAAIDANGITIEYDVHGADAGDPLLLVMGLGGQLIAWPLEFVNILVERGFRVVRYDNRDSGLSTMIDAPPPTTRQMVLSTISKRFAKHATYTLADLADDAAGLLDALGIERAHVVGASMGGMISQTLAIRHRDKTASLTSIMSNTGDRRHGRAAFGLLRSLSKLMSDDPVLAVDRGVEMARLTSGPHFDERVAREQVTAACERSYNPAGTGRQALAISASPDRTAALGTVTVPTLVIHGLADRLVRSSGGVATAKAVPGSRLVMYPDMAHDLPRPRWPEIADEIEMNARRARGRIGSRATSVP
jgi:pimeloyl-ACP methyl ester carboxylesterase